MKWQWNLEGHHSLHINQLMSAFILRLLQDLSKEGRGEEERLPRLPRKAQTSRVLSHVSLKAYLFQAPESINACIILWIPLFSTAKWLEHPCMKPISNFQSETHPRTTYRFSSKIAAIFDHEVTHECLWACSAHMCVCACVCMLK